MAKKIDRKRRVSGVLKSREDVDISLGEYARLVIERDSVAAEMDERIRMIRAEYEHRLTDLSEDAELEFDMIADWAARNPDTFAQRKSVEFTHGVVGFRTGTPKLKPKKGVKWSGVLILLTTLKRFEYIRTKSSADRERIIADREKLGKQGLDEMGVRVVQDESVFVEPKRESVKEE